MIEPILEADRLLLYGMLDRAEALYLGVLEADPKSGFALVGLARVAAERGDHAGTYRFSTEAVRVDASNAIAHALAVRSAELLARGGKPVPTVGGSERRSLLDRALRRG